MEETGELPSALLMARRRLLTSAITKQRWKYLRRQPVERPRIARTVRDLSLPLLGLADPFAHLQGLLWRQPAGLVVRR